MRLSLRMTTHLLILFDRHPLQKRRAGHLAQGVKATVAGGTTGIEGERAGGNEHVRRARSKSTRLLFNLIKLQSRLFVNRVVVDLHEGVDLWVRRDAELRLALHERMQLCGLVSDTLC